MWPINSIRRPAPGEPGPNSRPSARRLSSLVLLGGAAIILAGCSTFGRGTPEPNGDNGFFGWHFHAPFDTRDVKTVAIFFKTQTFRRDLEKQLHEAVAKEIELRTPYKVVGNHENADSLLTGVITTDNKNLIVEAPTNLPRQLNATLTVSLKWTHNPPTEIEDKQVPTIVAETINFVPEVGETTLSAYNHVIQSIAKQIVDMMEEPWFDENDPH